MNDHRITRRRAITVLAAAAATLTGGRSVADKAVADYEWRGFAMGTDARIVFSGVDGVSARAAASMAAAEIERIERALSLFRPDSEIVRLNRAKTLASPTGDMMRALRLALDIADRTNGLFDPTVHALWEAHVDWFAASPDADLPPNALIADTLKAVDWRKVELTSGSVRIADGQRITLNGLGQGYVTDRIADLLRRRGFAHVLVDLGEQRALGPDRDGKPWLIARPGAIGIALSDGALATSEGEGCVLGAGGVAHHLFDPRTGRSSQQWRRITVHHPSAAVADAMSTAFYAASAPEITALVEKFERLVVWATDREGRETQWKSSSGAVSAATTAPA
ncbi:MAG: FAD:protein FMN transferase [Pseudolabrys sp.]